MSTPRYGIAKEFADPRDSRGVGHVWNVIDRQTGRPVAGQGGTPEVYFEKRQARRAAQRLNEEQASLFD